MSIFTFFSYNAYQRLVSLRGGAGPAYFLAPVPFLGDKLTSYGQQLSFRLRLGAEVTGASPGAQDVILEGGFPVPFRVSASITSQGNPLPTDKLQQYHFHLHETAGWSPPLAAMELLSLLANLTAVRIRGSYAAGGRGYLDQVELEGAAPGFQGNPADWVERCDCPPGNYQVKGRRSCLLTTCYLQATRASTARTASQASTGSRGREDTSVGASPAPATATPTSATPRPASAGVAIIPRVGSQEGIVLLVPTAPSTGAHCSECSPGYFGEATQGSPDSCQPCPCPNVASEGVGGRPGSCYAVVGDLSEETVCTECPEGRTGARCQHCSEGSWGNPVAGQSCQPCDCNGNTDTCNPITGECLKCAGHTTGWHCEQCMEGYYGSATEGSGCSACRCHGPGSVPGPRGQPQCSQEDGECSCKENVVGRHCDQCLTGYWNIHSAAGCDPCNCDPIGSMSGECDLRTGACRCRPGVAGQRCDTCAPHHWGFGLEGCTTCDCDMQGATSSQCDELTGQCVCREGVEGRRCERCQENTEIKKGQVGERVCEPCDNCYTLIKLEVDEHRAQLEQLADLLQTIAENPEPVGDTFEGELRKVEARVSVLLEEAQRTVGGGGLMRHRLEELSKNLASVRSLVRQAEALLDEAEVNGGEGQRLHRGAVAEIRRAQQRLGQARAHLQGDAAQALRQAQERARRYGEGSERMTGIAGRARELAEQQERDAGDMKRMAEAALEMASTANQLARDAAEEQVKKGERISALRAHISELDEKLTTVQSLSLATQRDATAAYNQALAIYQQAFNLETALADNTGVIEGAAGVKGEAARLRSTAEQLLQENMSLLGRVVTDREELEELLARAVAQQQQVDARLDDLTGHQDKAAAAVQRGNSILEQARATLETLR